MLHIEPAPGLMSPSPNYGSGSQSPEKLTHPTEDTQLESSLSWDLNLGSQAADPAF